MNSYKALTKTFISQLSMSKAQDKRRKIMITILSIFAVVGIIIPVALLTGFFVKVTTESLLDVSLETLGIKLMLYVICIFTVVFGISVILNELYFSNDIEYLLPWPLRTWQIVASKFTSAYIGENLMQFVFTLACIIGFGLGTNMGILNWIIAIVGIPLITLLPMIYCAIISILIMRFTRLFKNKDLVQKITILIIFIVLLLLLGLTKTIKNFDLDIFVNNISNINNSNFKILQILFPNVPVYINAINNGSILSFILYLLINLISIGIMLLIAELFYYKGVINLAINNHSSNRKTITKLIATSKKKPVFLSYFLKEVKILYRTPTFYTHCIVANFLWPIFFYAICKIQESGVTITWLRENYMYNQNIKLFIVTFIIGISSFVASLNSISSNAISREGKHFSFMKYIPVNYKIQLHAKALVGIIFAFLGVMIFFIPACFILKIPITHIIIYTILGTLSIIFISYLGLYIDSIQPKLVWNEELSVLRENYNMFYSMAITIDYIALICFGGYFLLKDLNLSFLQISIIFISIVMICNLVIYLISKKNIIRNIATQEEM